MRAIHRSILLLLLANVGLGLMPARSDEPIPLIFDTDMGNDIDDALALAVIHSLQTRGECRLLAVTITKDNPYAPSFIQAVNTFYGRPTIPLGMVDQGKTPEASPYLTGVVEARDPKGEPLYPTTISPSNQVPKGVDVLRQALADAKDTSVVIVQVGFSTNLAALLDSAPDRFSPLPGKELVARKVRLLSAMAGNFAPTEHTKEYNVFIDAPAARKLFDQWPTPIVASGFEIGRAILYPAQSIQRDYSYVPHHPIAHAYTLYQKMPYDRETWDLTSVLVAVRPGAGYFGLSDPGTISVDESDVTQFRFHPTGKHFYLTASPEQATRVREALVQLASQPPSTP
jgi:inosine-uridine nucleoside N-ribohydrolase